MFSDPDSCLVHSQGLPEAFVEVERDDGFGELVEIAAQDICGIVYGVAGPVETLAIAIGRVEYRLKVLDTLCRATESKDSLDVDGCRI